MAHAMLKSMEDNKTSSRNGRSDRKDAISEEEDGGIVNSDVPIVTEKKKKAKKSTSKAGKERRARNAASRKKNKSSNGGSPSSSSSSSSSGTECDPDNSSNTTSSEEGYWVTDMHREQINQQICDTIQTTMAGLWSRYGNKRKMDQNMTGSGNGGSTSGGGRGSRKQKKVLMYPDGTVLKKPPSAYLLWSKDERQVLKDEKVCPSDQTLIVLGERWQTKTSEEKRPYEQEALRQQAVYDIEKEKCQLVAKPETTGRRGGGSSKKMKVSSPPADDSIVSV